MTEKQVIELLKAATNEYLSKLEALWKTIEVDSQVVVVPPVIKPISHFTGDLNCKHCGKVGPYAENYSKLVAKLEKLRTAIGNKPIHVLSGYRCPTHNAEVGGATNSYHMQDMAADIYVDGMSVDQVATAAISVGFGGIGRYYDQQFTHVDIGPVAGWTQGSKGFISVGDLIDTNEKIRKEG